MEENEKQEMAIKSLMLQQHSQEIEQNLQLIDSQLSELADFSRNLRELDTNQNREIISSVGKGVYIKSFLSGKEIYVDIGSGVVVKKTSQEAVNIIEEQIPKLREAKMQLTAQLELFHQEFYSLISKIQDKGAV